jgi:hypothetical protein
VASEPDQPPLSGELDPDELDDDAHIDWVIREIDAGRQQIPPERDLAGPSLSLSLGDACEVDPALLAAMCGPDGLGGQAVSAAFGQDHAADVLRPGPVLAVLTAQQVGRAGQLTDDELTGALQAARRLANLAGYQQTVVIAEFARRRESQYQAAAAKGKPAARRDGEFPGEELAMELMETSAYAGMRIDTALELTSRLPRTLAGLRAGSIDLCRALTIAARTAALTDADAAYADEVLAAAAPGKRADQLARKAAALEMKLAPEAVRARKELARHLDQRVEARREDSGNASLAGRELDTAQVMASKAYIDAIAAQLRASGQFDATIGQLRALALTDLTQGRRPLDRVRPPAALAQGPAPQPAVGPPSSAAPPSPAVPPSSAAPPSPAVPPSPAAPAPAGTAPRAGRDSGDPPQAPLDPVPLPALINVVIPIETLLGQGTAPAHVAGWGLLDADESATFVRAAAGHPRTRWCITVTARDGTALAHGCAPGQHPWPESGPPWPASGAPRGALRPPSHRRPYAPGGTPGRDPDPPLDGSPPGDHHRPAGGTRSGEHHPPPGGQLSALLRRLNITVEPIARGTCDHGHAERRYVPSRILRHLVRARAQTCSAPGCNAQAIWCDIDHSVPYPDGPTCQCNLNPKCRRHHRIKQAPGWRVTQPSPDTAAWTTPSGRIHTSTATVYDR